MLIATASALCVIALVGGFVWFVQLAAAPPTTVPHADGIVVLTGGSNRVDQGLRLLAQGFAPRLLISGVGPGTTLATLVRQAGLDPAIYADRITLGDTAVSTRGNAEETLEWLRGSGMRTLIVVTAFYHMPRALAELRRALPMVRLYPSPVLPDALLRGDARTPITLLVKEYAKFLAFQLGATRFGINRRGNGVS